MHAEHSAAVVLNFDVLLSIMHWLPRESLLSMTRTCRLLHAAGVKILLKHVEVRRRETLRQLRRFLEKDNERLKHLMSLRYQIGPALPNPTFMDDDDLSWLLRNALQLQTLMIRCASIRPYSEKVLQPLASRTSLTTFAWEGNASLADVRRILAHIHAGLEVVSLTALVLNNDVTSFWHPQRDHEFSVFDYNPIPLLSHFQETLRELVVSWVKLTPPRNGLVFPQMRKLEIQSCAELQIGFLVQAFPYLEELSLVRPTGYPKATPGQVYVDLCDGARAQNKQSQLEPENRWTSLRVVKGFPYPLYAAGLSCDVHHVSLKLDAATNTSVVHDVLSDTSPRILTLDMNEFLLKSRDVGALIMPLRNYLQELNVDLMMLSGTTLVQDSVVSIS